MVGPGRAGRSFEQALSTVGAHCVDVIGRSDDPQRLDPSLDLVVIAVPDQNIGRVAGQIPRGPLVVHVSGATTLEPLLTHHTRCGSIHPLMSLPDPETGAAALLAQAHLAIAGSSLDVVRELLTIAEKLEAKPFVVDDSRRAEYHAAASIAANHLVALTAQVERIATMAELPLLPFLDMMRAVLDNVERVGPAAALTGPVARADWSTVTAHLNAIPEAERELYLLMARSCADLAGHDFPFPLDPSPEEPA